MWNDEYQEKYYEENRDLILEKKRSSYDPANKRAKDLWSKYRLTVEQYYQMFIDQNNCCAICKREKPLVVDHCHKTGKVRGLLCTRCNTGLGKLEDYIKEAAEYVNAAL